MKRPDARALFRRLGGLLPSVLAATLVLVAVHEGACALVSVLGGLQALSGPLDGALAVALAFLVLFAARITLLFLAPAALLYAVVTLPLRKRPASGRTQPFRRATSKEPEDRATPWSKD